MPVGRGRWEGQDRCRGQRQKLLGIKSISYRDIFYSTRKYRLFAITLNGV